jgi:hypothetical protein
MDTATLLHSANLFTISDLVNSSLKKWVVAVGFVAVGVAIAAAGIYVGDTDDAPGAALAGILLMIVALALGVRAIRRKT